MDTDLDIVVVNYRTPDLVQNFLDSFCAFEPQLSYTISIVDVDPVSSSDFFLFGKPVNDFGVRVIETEENVGYSGACNMAASLTSGRNIAFFNSDTEFVNDACINKCVDFLDANPSVGIVGPLQYSSDRRCTHGGIFGSLDKPIHRGWKSKNIDLFRDTRQAVTVSGSAYFVKRSAWNIMTSCNIYQDVFPGVVGAFLPTPHYYEETGCSYHAQAHGYEVWYHGEAEMIHEWHKSSPQGATNKYFKISQVIFRDFCDAHGIEHD